MARLQGAAAWRRRSLRRAAARLLGEGRWKRAAAGAAALTAAAALAATGAAAAATGAAAAATAAWEGEEQEISSLQESMALIPDVGSSIFTLIELRGWQ